MSNDSMHTMLMFANVELLDIFRIDMRINLRKSNF